MNVYFFVCSSVLLVSVKPQQLFQTLPTQYQQNGYQIYDGLPLVSDNNPYYQVQTNHNPVAHSQPSLSHQLSQIFVNRLFTNPAIKTILDPNTRMVNQHGVEVQRQVPNTQNTPNIVNNYIIVPPEYLNFTENVRNNKKHKNNQRRNEGHRRIYDGDRDIENYHRNQNRRRSKPNHDFVETKRDKQQNSNRRERHGTRKPKIKRNKNRDDNKNDLTIQRNDTDMNIKDNESVNKSMTNNLVSNTKNHENTTEIPIEIIVKTNINNKNITIQNQSKTDVNKKSNKEEKAIKEFRQKFPGIPEDVLKSLIEHMRKQMQNYKFGNSFYPTMNYPLSFDQLFGHYNNIGTTTRKPKRRNKNRNRNQKKRKNQRNKHNTERNNDENLKSSTTTTTTTTNKVNQTITTEKSSIKPTTERKTELPHIYEENKSPQNTERILEALEFDVNTDLKTADEFDNELVQEYFPDFKNDKQYLTSEEEQELKHLDSRYYYTTDRNYDVDDRDRKFQPMHYIIPLERDSDSTEDTIMRPDITDNYFESNSQKPEETQTIKFMTPPPLEMIDFETKPVNKERFKIEKFDRPIYDPYSGYIGRSVDKIYADDTEKYSAYSKSKNARLNDKKVEKKPMNGVETVYARSKVVKYGIPDEEFEPNISGLEDKVTLNKGTTFVIAKSYPDQVW